MALEFDNAGASPQYLEAALNSLDALLAVIDEHGTIEWVNSAWARFSAENGGSPNRTGVGANYLGICGAPTGPPDAEIRQIEQGIRDVIAGRKASFECDYPCHTPTQERWFAMHVKPLEFDGPRKFVVCHQTITERERQAGDERYVVELEVSKKAFEEQAAQMAELAEKQAQLSKRLQYELDVKDRFFSIIAHDLKSPFNSLLGMTQAMAEMSELFTKEKLVEYAGAVNESATRVFDLLQNLLQWSRMHTHTGQPAPEGFAVAALAQEGVDVLEPFARGKRVVLNNRINGETAFADPNMARTVFRNLIENALKFTPAGGAVELSSTRQGDMVKVTVSDTGVGIAADKLDRIFALDYMTSTPGTAGEIGTGLGLPLCCDMVARNGGRIWVDSAPGQGSRFHFTLPAAPARDGRRVSGAA